VILPSFFIDHGLVILWMAFSFVFLRDFIASWGLTALFVEPFVCALRCVFGFSLFSFEVIILQVLLSASLLPRSIPLLRKKIASDFSYFFIMTAINGNATNWVLMAPRPDFPGAHWCMRCLNSAALLTTPFACTSLPGAAKCSRCLYMGLPYILVDSRLDAEAGVVVRAQALLVSTGVAALRTVRDNAVGRFQARRNQLCGRINRGLAPPYGPPRPPPPAPPAPPAPPVPFWRRVYLAVIARLWGALFVLRGALFAVRGALFGALSFSGLFAFARSLAGDFVKFIFFSYTLRMLERFIPWSFDFDESVQFVLVFLGLRPPRPSWGQVILSFFVRLYRWSFDFASFMLWLPRGSLAHAGGVRDFAMKVFAFVQELFGKVIGRSPERVRR
jgi:hypothetical protein